MLIQMMRTMRIMALLIHTLITCLANVSGIILVCRLKYCILILLCHINHFENKACSIYLHFKNVISDNSRNENFFCCGHFLLINYNLFI